MTTYYLRAITSKYDLSTEVQIKHATHKLLLDAGVHVIEFHTFAPYWKTEDQGELTCKFSTSIPLEEILCLFADQWKSNTADSRWSDIHLPNTSFLWISD